MVLYKRKQVVFSRPPALPDDLNKEVFYIPATKEWFFDYDEYLQKMDYYNRRKFVCEITGNSCLTFFQALESENKEIKGVERKFPEALREHILRFLQFNRITRLDQLVDKVYLVFKNEYYPGETVYLKGSILSTDSGDHGARHRCTIKEKIQYSNPTDGALTKYLIVRLGDMKESIVGSDKITRDRNHFTKWLIKTFIKLTMTRSHKVGAPWVVKNKYADIYNIPRKYPDDLKHFESTTPSGDILYGEGISPAPPSYLDEEKKSNKRSGHASGEGRKKLKPSKSKGPEEEIEKMTTEYYEKTYPLHHEPEVANLGATPDEKGVSLPSASAQKKQVTDDLDLKFNLQYHKPLPKPLILPNNAKDLIRDNDDPNMNPESCQRTLNSVQEALECWVFMNVYHKVLLLDTFTFDDFIYAMGWNIDQYKYVGRCQLLDEIWCGVLGAIVSNTLPKNPKPNQEQDYELMINLPEDNVENAVTNDELETDMMETEEDNENEAKLVDHLMDSNVSHPEIDVQADSGDGVDKNESNSNGLNGLSDKASQNGEDETDGLSEKTEDEDAHLTHQAYIAMNYRNVPWYERLRKRNFKDGNWQCILLGVLSLLEHVNEFKEIIMHTFETLAPLSMSPSASTVLNQFYENLDIDSRIKVLNILVTLLIDSKVVRKYIDECLDASTTLRRNRLDIIRDYKMTWDVAQKLNIEVREMLQEEKETNKAKKKVKTNSKDSQTKEKAGMSPVANDANKKRPKLNLNISEMSQKETRLAEKNKEFRDIWERRKAAIIKLNELRQTKREIEKQLNELDCQRVKLLGKDRFYNRYWWFENNGLPTLYSGANDDDEEAQEEEEDGQDNDVLEETYLMGRLWVQGPSRNDLSSHFVASDLQGIAQLTSMTDYVSHLDYDSLNDKQAQAEEESLKSRKPHEIGYIQYPKEFQELCEKYLKLKFESDFVSRTYENSLREDVVLNQYGGLTTSSLSVSLTPLQRRALEESPDPLFEGICWRYYDNVEDVNRLIEWLNPWGRRESLLRKELQFVRDAIENSIEARRNALGIDFVELQSQGALETTDETSPNEIKKDQANECSTPGVQIENGESNIEDNLGNEENSRNENAIKTLTDKDDEKPFAKEMSSFKADWANLEKEQSDRDLTRVLEWVNSMAINKLEKSLYEGGDKFKIKNSRK